MNKPIIKSVQNFQALLNMMNKANFCILLINPNMEIIWMNKFLKNQFPQISTLKKILYYKSFHNIVQDEPSIYYPALDVIKTGKTNSVQQVFCIKRRTYKIVSTPVRDNNNDVTYVLETMFDITDKCRKKVERKESIYEKALADFTQYSVKTFNINTLTDLAVTLTARAFSTRFSNIMEYIPHNNSFLVKSCSGWDHNPIDYLSVENDYNSLPAYILRNREPVIVENSNNEKRFNVSMFFQEYGLISSITVVVNGEFKPFGVLSVYTTKRRKFQKVDVDFLKSISNILATSINYINLQKEQTVLIKATEQNPDIVMITDTFGNIKHVNSAYSKTIGYSAKKNRNLITNIFELHKSQPNVFDHLWNQINSGIVGTTERCDHKVGGIYHCENIKVSPIKNKNGLITNFMVIKKDISLLKQLEKEKENIKKQLIHSQKMETIGLLAGGVAHDFNNMLTAINGFSSLALININNPDKLNKYLDRIKKSASVAETIARQLLLFSRKQSPTFNVTSLNTTIDDIKKIIGRLIGDNILIELDFEDGLTSIYGNKGNIEQVIMNLALNAKDAMPEGGKITIKTENLLIDMNSRTKTPYSRCGRFVCLTFTDTGEGMDNETIQQVFKPFFTTKSTGKGTGLGLSVVFNIIKEHKGWVNAASTIGKGTTFKIYFPLYLEPPKGNVEEKEVPEHFRRNKKNILVVEDEEQVQSYIIEALSKLGYVVFSAMNFKEACTLFEIKHNCIDTLFSDVVLPDGSGIAMAEKFTAKNPRLHVVLTSGYVDDNCGLDQIEKKGFKYLPKPYILGDVLQAIEK